MVNSPANVIGPISREDWTTMLYLRDSISYMKQKNASKFVKAINKEEKLYKEVLGKYKCAA